MPKQLYKFCPSRPSHAIRLTAKTTIYGGQCVYLDSEVGDAMKRMRPVDPETGSFLDLEPVQPEAPVVIEVEEPKAPEVVEVEAAPLPELPPEPEVVEVIKPAKKSRRVKAPRSKG